MPIKASGQELQRCAWVFPDFQQAAGGHLHMVGAEPGGAARLAEQEFYAPASPDGLTRTENADDVTTTKVNIGVELAPQWCPDVLFVNVDLHGAAVVPRSRRAIYTIQGLADLADRLLVFGEEGPADFLAEKPSPVPAGLGRQFGMKIRLQRDAVSRHGNHSHDEPPRWQQGNSRMNTFIVQEKTAQVRIKKEQ